MLVIYNSRRITVVFDSCLSFCILSPWLNNIKNLKIPQNLIIRRCCGCSFDLKPYVVLIFSCILLGFKRKCSFQHILFETLSFFPIKFTWNNKLSGIRIFFNEEFRFNFFHSMYKYKIMHTTISTARIQYI